MSINKNNEQQHITNNGNSYPEKEITCFRCGVCCSKYQGIATIAEAQCIADSFGISIKEFYDRYVDEAWPDPENYLLDAYNGACVFLRHDKDSRLSSCSIHHIRPRVCREWQPGWHRPECREGLSAYWGLTVSPSGKLQGPTQRIREFKAFLKSLEH